MIPRRLNGPVHFWSVRLNKRVEATVTAWGLFMQCRVLAALCGPVNDTKYICYNTFFVAAVLSFWSLAFCLYVQSQPHYLQCPLHVYTDRYPTELWITVKFFPCNIWWTVLVQRWLDKLKKQGMRGCRDGVWHTAARPRGLKLVEIFSPSSNSNTWISMVAPVSWVSHSWTVVLIGQLYASRSVHGIKCTFFSS